MTVSTKKGHPNPARKIFSFSERVNDFLEFAYSEDSLTATQIAKEIQLSVAHFYREAKTHLKTTPLTYLREFRLTKASYLLSNPNIRINEVSIDCGFKSPSQFTRAFKNKFGLCPKLFRQIHYRINEE